jgi:hypothetical protein
VCTCPADLFKPLSFIISVTTLAHSSVYRCLTNNCGGCLDGGRKLERGFLGAAAAARTASPGAAMTVPRRHDGGGAIIRRQSPSINAQGRSTKPITLTRVRRLRALILGSSVWVHERPARASSEQLEEAMVKLALSAVRLFPWLRGGAVSYFAPCGGRAYGILWPN